MFSKEKSKKKSKLKENKRKNAIDSLDEDLLSELNEEDEFQKSFKKPTIIQPPKSRIKPLPEDTIREEMFVDDEIQLLDTFNKKQALDNEVIVLENSPPKLLKKDNFLKPAENQNLLTKKVFNNSINESIATSNSKAEKISECSFIQPSKSVCYCFIGTYRSL